MISSSSDSMGLALEISFPRAFTEFHSRINFMSHDSVGFGSEKVKYMRWFQIHQIMMFSVCGIEYVQSLADIVVQAFNNFVLLVFLC
ncbi:hypothetical protein TNCV_853151 [Trichonephila clavipes]|nr:hypothetical protein TNCV_853151 [Trichonephila clavipes]